MSRALVIDDRPLKLSEVRDFVFRREDLPSPQIEITPSVINRIRQSESHLHSLLGKRIPIYGVTTGFGDSCFRLVAREKSAELQNNLISYLSCGTGPTLPKEVSRAALLFRLKSLSRGYSGVSAELIERLKFFLEKDWIPVIPREGSLGASGDLIPLAYIAQALRGEGMLHSDQGPVEAALILKNAHVSPYQLKPKEGLALVNGTSAMAGYCLLNLQQAQFLVQTTILSTSWLCLALRGRTEAFESLVNEKAKNHNGQAQVARAVRSLLCSENYQSNKIRATQQDSRFTEELIQDRYSLRCVPQILGPVVETISMASSWLECEINGTSDNPLFDDDGSLGMGGNFYGGYLSHGMDYLKISLAHIADLLDRQLTLLIDDKSNRGLTPNLTDWSTVPEQDRFLYHGLKGLHQAVNAITSEILAKAIPNGIFSRSSESHNQDKVSLGMSAASQCADMLESLFTIQAMYLVCGAQALDLRGITLQGDFSKYMYSLVRAIVPKVERDRSLGQQISNLSKELKQAVYANEKWKLVDYEEA